MKILFLVTSCFFLLGISGCSSLYYFPDSNLYYRPERLPVVPVQFELRDAKNRKIIGWYFKNKDNVKPKARILFFHGNAQNLSSHFVSLYWILEHGYDYFIFDYPGYGGSEGEPNPDSVVEASFAALKWIHELDPKTPTAIFGQSLGGNISMYTTARYQNEFPVCQITVDSTFYSYRQVGRTVLANNPWTWALQWTAYLLATNYKSASENLDKIPPTPFIVIHGDRDRVVDIANGRRLFKEAKEPKEFWFVPNGEHISAFTGPLKKEFQEKYLGALKRDCGQPTTVQTKSEN